MKIAENYHQQEAVIWFRNNYCLKHHNPRCIIFSVPNESEDGREAQKKVNSGLMKGVSDVIVLLPNAKCVLMECKAENGYQSPAQKSFEETAVAIGFNYHLFRSKEQFISLISPYLIECGLEVKNG